MRRAVLLLAVIAFSIVVASGVALAATITGTANDETLIGTSYADTIRAGGATTWCGA